MSGLIKKITVGFVVQTWDDDKKRWVSQDFVAGDQVDWETEDGTPIVVDSTSEVPYLHFNMVQPED